MYGPLKQTVWSYVFIYFWFIYYFYMNLDFNNNSKERNNFDSFFWLNSSNEVRAHCAEIVFSYNNSL